MSHRLPWALCCVLLEAYFIKDIKGEFAVETEVSLLQHDLDSGWCPPPPLVPAQVPGLPTFKGIWTWKVGHLRIRPSVPYFPLYVYQLKLVTKPLMQNKDNEKVYNYFQSSLKSIKMQVNWHSTRLAGMKP